jgi:hypothetical protein
MLLLFSRFLLEIKLTSAKRLDNKSRNTPRFGNFSLQHFLAPRHPSLVLRPQIPGKMVSMKLAGWLAGRRAEPAVVSNHIHTPDFAKHSNGSYERERIRERQRACILRPVPAASQMSYCTFILESPFLNVGSFAHYALALPRLNSGHPSL